jgi:hypothetical protein
MDSLRNAPASFQNASLLIDDVPPANTATATAQQLATTADSLPDPGGSAKLSSLIAGLQSNSNKFVSLTSQLQQGSSSAIPSFEQLQAAIAAQIARINTLSQQLQQGQSGSVDPAVMFQLQIQMQVMSQYIEACSNVLSAIHQQIMSMARATKGQ